MGRVNYFEIQLEKAARGVFHGGQQLRGTVVIDVEIPIIVRDLYIIFSGASHTYWVNKTSDKLFEGSDNHFKSRVDLEYQSMSSDTDTIPTGVHQMPFLFVLPDNVPSSFEGEYGYTRYTVCAKIEVGRHTSFMNSDPTVEYQSETTFPVSPLTARSNSRPEPVRSVESVDIVGCLGKRGSVEVELVLARSEFHAGEPLLASVAINNISRNTVKDIEFILFQHTKFQAISRYESVVDFKEMNQVIEQSHLGSLGPNKSQHWPITIIIPNVPPSQVGRIIGIAYWAKLLCKDAGVEVTLPVVILSQFVS